MAKLIVPFLLLTILLGTSLAEFTTPDDVTESSTTLEPLRDQQTKTENVLKSNDVLLDPSLLARISRDLSRYEDSEELQEPAEARYVKPFGFYRREQYRRLGYYDRQREHRNKFLRYPIFAGR